ncbi:peptidylprolyl isomerase [bacterium]|nr:peptidylprolyl isomerase [bacterium]
MRQMFRNLLSACLALTLFACAPSKEDAHFVPAEPARQALLNPEYEIWSQKSPDVFRVMIETSKGSFTLSVHRDWAPLGVDRFYNLVRTGYYDDSRFFRVLAGFIVQFGIPGNPEITAVWKDLTIPDDPVTQSNTRGRIAYAMTGPDTRTTQLYISLDDNSRLDEQGFSPIGEVIEGMEVVDQLYSGYGEEAGGGMRRGKQDKMLTGGNAHLDEAFPRLDKLIRAKIVTSVR